MYDNKIINEFSLIKSRLSKLKAEKVVKAPQNPIIKKRDKSDFKRSVFEKIWKKNPINKHPIKLTIKLMLNLLISAYLENRDPCIQSAI